MKRVQFSVSYPERLRHPLHRRTCAESAVTRVELLMWSPTADATALLWCDADRAGTERVFDAVDSLLGRSLVETDGGTYAFVRQSDYEFPAEVLAAVAESRVIFVPPVVFCEDGGVRFEAVGETSSVSSLHDRLAELGDLTVERVHEFRRTRSPSSLTDRQRAAVETAVELGYYDVPRDGSVADVADELACSTSTAGELLRKAESTVLRQFAEARGT